MQVHFSENACKIERIGSHRGGRAPGMPPIDPPMVMHQLLKPCHMPLPCSDLPFKVTYTLCNSFHYSGLILLYIFPPGSVPQYGIG